MPPTFLTRLSSVLTSVLGAAPPHPAPSTVATADLIDALAADLTPCCAPIFPKRLALGVGLGAAASTALVGLILGYRPDLATTSATGVFWAKLVYPIALSALALWCVERLSRPDGDDRLRRRWLIAPILAVAAAACWRLSQTSGPRMGAAVMGASAGSCPWLIVLASLPPLAGLIWAVSGQAPTRLAATGAMVGVAAGGVGAAAYALHCTESSLPFLAVWYTVGIGAAALIGGVLGHRLLRW